MGFFVFRNLLFLIAVLWGLTACASGEKPTNPQFSSMSEPLSFETKRRDEINLIVLIDPENRRLELPTQACQKAEEEVTARKKNVRERATRQQLECAFQAFKTYYTDYQTYINLPQTGGEQFHADAASSLSLAIRRNEIQDRMLLRSDTLCRDFERRLGIQLRIENDTNLSNWMRNSQRRLVGGVGALVLGGDMVWALSNMTRITDLPGYVHDEGKIEKTMVRLATEGMKLQREQLFRSIDSLRRAPPRHGGLSYTDGNNAEGITPITIYSLERAIADALTYHSACSISHGLNYSLEHIITSPPTPSYLEFPTLMPSSINQ
ncbi:MAG: hypothetical protein AAF723_05730 [Pseudomonadota bacterium]